MYTYKIKNSQNQRSSFQATAQKSLHHLDLLTRRKSTALCNMKASESSSTSVDVGRQLSFFIEIGTIPARRTPDVATPFKRDVGRIYAYYAPDFILELLDDNVWIPKS